MSANFRNSMRTTPVRFTGTGESFIQIRLELKNAKLHVTL
jgi:hypothetical protein